MTGHDHNHDHDHEHDHSQDHEHESQLNHPVGAEADVAASYLSNALRHSFMILKVIMLVLILVFLGLGFKTVPEGERALVLRFGKIRGGPESRVLAPRTIPYWVMPYPIDEMVRIPVGKPIDLSIKSFWYYESARDLIEDPTKKNKRVPQTLDPTKDGYCLTRSESAQDLDSETESSDYNIVHIKWQLVYEISDPELFFENVHVDDVKPGQLYFDVITNSVKPLLLNMFDDAVVASTVNYTIDEVLYERVAGLTEHVKRLLQENLDKIRSGIKVSHVQLIESTWPRQVDAVFEAEHTASQMSEQEISQARTYAENTLNQAGGPVASQLVDALHDPNIGETRLNYLWSQLAGEAREKIAEARAYKTDVVESAKANADYLKQLLPEYKKRPELVLQKIYQDTISDVMNNADEKIVFQSGDAAAGAEIRLQVSRDPSIKPRSETNGTSGQTGAAASSSGQGQP